MYLGYIILVQYNLIARCGHKLQYYLCTPPESAPGEAILQYLVQVLVLVYLYRRAVLVPLCCCAVARDDDETARGRSVQVLVLCPYRVAQEDTDRTRRSR